MSDVDSIQTALRRFDRRLRLLAAVRLLLTCVAVAGGTALVAALVDRAAPLPPVVRAGVMAVLAIEIVGGVAASAFVLFATRFDPVAAARKVEAGDAAWGERLSTVITQAAFAPQRRASAGLLGVLSAEVAGEVRARPPVRLASVLLVWPGVMAVLLVAIAWAGASSFATLELPQLVRRQMRPFTGPPPVTTTRIAIEPHATSVRQGDSFTVAAEVSMAEGPVTIDVGTDLEHTRTLQMRQEAGRRYAVTLLAVQRDFVYRIRAGDAVAGPVSVRVSRVPGVSELTITTRAADGAVRVISFDGGVAFVPAGAACELILHATEALSAVNIRVGNADVSAVADEDRQTWRVNFSATADASIAIVLVGESGIVAHGPAGLSVKVLRP